MGRYLGKRLISTIPLLLVISFVVFMFIHMIPGDPARLVAGQDATKEDVAVVREQLGLDEPLLVQYGKYMKGLFTGDLGNSIKNGKTVAETIAPRLKPTIMLTFSSMIWAAIIGIAIGIIAAVFHGRILDYVGMIIAIAGISVPSFWLGLELIQLFSVSLGWLPTSGLETWKSYILPSLTMGAGIMAVLARFSRSSMLETMREDYVRTARAKGLSESLVVMRHAFKNSDRDRNSSRTSDRWPPFRICYGRDSILHPRTWTSSGRLHPDERLQSCSGITAVLCYRIYPDQPDRRCSLWRD